MGERRAVSIAQMCALDLFAKCEHRSTRSLIALLTGGGLAIGPRPDASHCPHQTSCWGKRWGERPDRAME